jgi:hypothetical protein
MEKEENDAHNTQVCHSIHAISEITPSFRIITWGFTVCYPLRMIRRKEKIFPKVIIKRGENCCCNCFCCRLLNFASRGRDIWTVIRVIKCSRAKENSTTLLTDLGLLGVLHHWLVYWPLESASRRKIMGTRIGRTCIFVLIAASFRCERHIQ